MLKIAEEQGRGNKNLEIGSSKQKLRWFNSKIRLLAIALVLFLLTLSYHSNLNSGTPEIESKWYEMQVPSREEVQELNQKLEEEVENYIKENSFGYSKLNSRNLIQACSEQNFDIILALSQAQIESHFGTRGVAARTNSVFNVGTFDNGVILYRYPHPDLSVSPYIKLVKYRYMLGDKKSSQDLLRPRSFVNYRGARYASLKSYEYRVKGVYDKIMKETPIDSLWKEYNSNEYTYSRELWQSVDRFYASLK